MINYGFLNLFPTFWKVTELHEIIKLNEILRNFCSFSNTVDRVSLEWRVNLGDILDINFVYNENIHYTLVREYYSFHQKVNSPVSISMEEVVTTLFDILNQQRTKLHPNNSTNKRACTSWWEPVADVFDGLNVLKTTEFTEIFKMNQINTSKWNSYEQYATAILRPNVLTSEAYSDAFINGIEISFIYNKIDKNTTITDAELKQFVELYRKKGHKVSFERGYDPHGDISSIRFVVFNEARELVCIWMILANDYAIHFKDKEEVSELIKFMKEREVQIVKTISRCYSMTNGINVSSAKIDGRYRIHDEFYPNLKNAGGMKKVIDSFRKSKSNLLILAGQWGGGKSALFQAMCWEDTHYKNKYYLIDDPMVYTNSALFSEVISSIEEDNKDDITSYIFLEEADEFIRNKVDNPFLSRLASLINGASSMDVKIIIATNDGNESRIDPALLRPGRLFSLIKFSTMTPDEANTARAVMNLEPRAYDKNVALSEALSESTLVIGEGTTVTNKTKLGFTD